MELLTEPEKKLRDRLKNKSKGYAIPMRDRPTIKKMIAGGLSKKAACKVYGLTYRELKEQLSGF